MLPISTQTQTSWNQKVDDANSHVPHHQPIRRRSMNWSRPLWNHFYKTPHSPLQVGTHNFKGIRLWCLPLPGKAIKLFFSTSPQTLSLRFSLESGYRGKISATQVRDYRWLMTTSRMQAVLVSGLCHPCCGHPPKMDFFRISRWLHGKWLVSAFLWGWGVSARAPFPNHEM